MSRERVIVDIENLEQALKLEQTVRTGYCDPIVENLLAWIAVEEDLAISYERLSKTFTEQEKKNTIEMLSNESRNNVRSLQGLLKSVEEFGHARDRRQSLLEQLLKNP